MKKWLRKFLTFTLAAALVCPPLYAGAEEADSIQVESVGFEEGQMDVYLNQIGESGVSLDTVKVFIDNMQVPVTSVENVDNTTVPISYYCLVDVSGSVDEQRIDSAKQMINGIVDTMKAGDNMKIATVADDFVTSGSYLDNPDEIRAYLDTIERTHQDTNLFYAINECLTSLAGDAAVNPCRCLIIFSDGAEEQATGITRNEVIERNKELKICIYTVAMLKAKPSESELEAAKVLGSFARTSPGGVHFSPVLDGMEESEIPQAILQKISQKYLLNCQLQDIPLTGEKSAIKVELTLNNGTTYEDYLERPSAEIAEHVIDTPEPEPEEETVEETETVPSIEVSQEDEPEESKVSPVLIIALVAACVVLVVIIILVLVIWKKKKKTVSSKNDLPHKPGPEMKNPGGVDKAVSEKPAESKPGIHAVPKETVPVKPVDAVVSFTKIGRKKTDTFTIKLCGSCTVGRSGEKSTFVIADDKALSGRHCTLFYRNDAVWIRDEHSSNGTFVNGVPITGDYKLSQDDIIYIGSCEYRVTWKRG